jgi:hypothetical protein|tara:strand:- start:879 stop:1049 length:171 start_codon:yes stop_codon:yes gene_type:complete
MIKTGEIPREYSEITRFWQWITYRKRMKDRKVYKRKRKAKRFKAEKIIILLNLYYF